MSETLKLWFFRDLTDNQRLKLFGLFGLPVDEIGNVHGRQTIALRHILRKIVEMVRDETDQPPATVSGAPVEIHLWLADLIFDARQDGRASETDPEWVTRDFTQHKAYQRILAAFSPPPATGSGVAPQSFVDAAYELSTWTACVNWRGKGNEKEWLDELREKIEKVQRMANEIRSAAIPPAPDVEGRANGA